MSPWPVIAAFAGFIVGTVVVVEGAKVLVGGGVNGGSGGTSPFDLGYAAGAADKRAGRAFQSGYGALRYPPSTKDALDAQAGYTAGYAAATTEGVIGGGTGTGTGTGNLGLITVTPATTFASDPAVNVVGDRATLLNAKVRGNDFLVRKISNPVSGGPLPPGVHPDYLERWTEWFAAWSNARLDHEDKTRKFTPGDLAKASADLVNYEAEYDAIASRYCTGAFELDDDGNCIAMPSGSCPAGWAWIMDSSTGIGHCEETFVLPG